MSGSVASHDVNRYSGVRLGVDCLRDRHKPGVHALQLNEHVVCTPRYSCTDILVRACSRGSHNWYSRRSASLVSTVVHNAPQQLTFSIHYRTMDDLDAFQATIPHINDHISLSQDALALSVAIRFSKTPLRVSEACRTIHGYLTGPRARQRAEINEACLRNAWNFLHIAWDELDALRHSNAAGFIQPDDVDVFAQGWQVREISIFAITSFCLLLNSLPLDHDI